MSHCEEFNVAGCKVNGARLNEYFSHTMSMNKAKEILCIFIKEWDK